MGRDRLALLTPILILAIIPISFLTPGAARITLDLIPIALVLMMTLSMGEIQLRHLLDFKRILRPVLISISINLFFLTPLILILAYIMPDLSLSHRLGFSIMAASPPAIAVVGYTKILRGDLRISILSNLLAYIMAFLYTPLLISWFTGRSLAGISEIGTALLLYIVVPLLLSRAVSRIRGIKSLTRPVVIALPILILYAALGSNVNEIFIPSLALLEILVIGLLRTFISGSLVYYIALRRKIPSERVIVYSLFASYKNLGLAAALGLVLGGPATLIPIAICVPFESLYFAANLRRTT